MPSDDRQDLRLLAIVPAYNEEGMIGRVVRDIKRQAPDFNVLVVDDGSIDKTVALAEAEGAMVLRHPFNLGIGGAMQSGYKYALAHGYDVAVQVDGDGQHKPEYLPEMLDALRTGGKEADMVYGTRFRGDPGYKVPLGRRLGNLIFSVVLSAITRQKITDPTSGFRMVNRRGIELFARDYPHDYPEVEAILMLHNNRLRIHEVQVRMNARGFGRSSIDYPRAAYYMVKVMLALFVGLLRRRPDAFEGAPPPATGEFKPPSEPQRRGREARRERCWRSIGSVRVESSAASRRSSRSSVTVLFLVLVIELVRRRRLVERYALLWIAAAIILVVLAVWNGALEAGSPTRSGSSRPPNALFLLGLGAVFVLALHFSVAFSRLSEETKILAQEVARLDREQRRIRKGALGGEEDVAIGAVDPPAPTGD